MKMTRSPFISAAPKTMLTALCLSLATAAPQARVASLTENVIEHRDFASRILGNKRNLIVVLPPGYETEPKRRYPVFYFHDGQNLCNGLTSFIPNQEWRADETMKALVDSKLVAPFIIVGIDNAGAARGDEYLPTVIRDSRGNRYGGRADEYGEFLVSEVMPFVNRTYRTAVGPSNTYLGGSSFGGIVTLHLGLTRPDVFGRLAVMSPSVWVDDRVMLKRVTRKPLKIWLDMGTDEGPQGLQDARDLRDVLLAKGWRLGRDLAFFEDVGAQHNEAAWARRLPSVFTFLMR